MARILLIETATEVCSAAIAADGRVLALEEDLDSLNHAAMLTLQIERCVKTSGIPLAALDAVAVSRGPGSYTGLRVGASVAKGICYALDKPLIAVDTLLALAEASKEAVLTNHQSPITNRHFFLPMLDARRQEVWTAAYDAALQEIAPAQPLVIENNMFEKFLSVVASGTENGVFVLSGNGSLKIKNVPEGKNVVFSAVNKCSARHIAALAEQIFQRAEFQDVAYFEPFYMKAPNITVPSRPPF